MTITLTHNRIRLALHELPSAELSSTETSTTGIAGGPLLLLHGLGESTNTSPLPGIAKDHWNGPIFGLDFTGHGESDHSVGGGYSCEMLMADVDIALAQLGPSTIAGRGLGAYVALLIAGARPKLVRGAVLADGPGLAGGATRPTSISIQSIDPSTVPGQPDPWALTELARDVRPPDYAMTLLRQAIMQSGLRYPIAVCAKWKPAWLHAVADDPSVLESTLTEALSEFRNSR
jgi:pimeloyl-ACP methyl ester carboxylesterase